ncbi:MAG: (d)CMP kinase [Clostridiales bacterium]|nr:(d)CMP kinase [Clostridiales bacterium]
MKTINIAIDGPSGAGKSSLAKNIAKRLGYIYVDTGALYRGVAYAIIEKKISPSDIEKVTAELENIKVYFKHIDGIQHVFVNGKDVSDMIRTHEISMAASSVSSIPAVRSFLLDCQREIAKTNNIVMDGRDVGTVVLPNADVKIFLTASVEDRAQRRYDEIKASGQPCDYNETLSLIKERDKNDSTRKIAPLKKADDAVLLDNSGFQPEDTVKAAFEIISDKLGDNYDISLR